MKRYGALFDLDGVLIDSEGTYTRFWQGIEDIYPTGVENFAIAIKGTTLESILNHYPDEAVRTDIVRRLQEFQSRMDYPVYPGVQEFLQQLVDAGFRTAIVTSSDPSKMERLWEKQPGLKQYFMTVIDGRQVSRSKPDPEGYLKAAAAVGCDPSDCFVFEDSMQGLKAGRASGAKVIGVATTYPADTVGSLADVVVGNVAELTPQSLLDLMN